MSPPQQMIAHQIIRETEYQVSQQLLNRIENRVGIKFMTKSVIKSI